MLKGNITQIMHDAEASGWNDLAQSLQDDVDMDFLSVEHVKEYGYAYPFTDPMPVIHEISEHHP